MKMERLIWHIFMFINQIKSYQRTTTLAFCYWNAANRRILSRWDIVHRCFVICFRENFKTWNLVLSLFCWSLDSLDRLFSLFRLRWYDIFLLQFKVRHLLYNTNFLCLSLCCVLICCFDLLTSDGDVWWLFDGIFGIFLVEKEWFGDELVLTLCEIYEVLFGI